MITITENLKRYARNFSWLFVAELAVRGASFVTIILIARALGTEQLGIYSYVMSLAFIFGTLVDFGMQPIIVRELARNKKEVGTYLRYGVTLKLFLAVIAFSLIVATGRLLGKSGDTEVLLAMASVWMIANFLIIFFGSIFRAFEKMHHVSFVRLVEKFSFLVALGTIFILGLTLKGVFVVYILTALLGLCIAIYIAQSRYHKFVLSFDFGFSKSLLRKSLPLALSGFAFLIYNRVDIIMLSLMQGDQAAGLYSTCYNLFLLAGLIPVLATAAVFPSFSNLYVTAREKLRQNYRKGLKILILLAMLVGVFTFFAAGWLIDILYGSAYVEAVTALRILMFSVLFYFPAHMLSRLLIIAGRQQVVLMISLTGTVTNIGLNLILIPTFSYVGASITMVITQLITVTIFFIGTRKIILSPKPAAE